ncbi:CheR family methyltransferase [Pelagicoccus albus]|uniref:protein-glutamate O-methyltransferase n=1 Tax=Pelagicoccus albus TaxID=415222 RepID=A0A7X1BA18_9BACT|nr:CheR family methyltransferase [Pelagicoccus albus]MBC2607168.1 protein-glutamate O-methyltransferase CheR [Pelagicoccus albus]
MSLSPSQFDYVSTLAKSRAAIVLQTGKEYLVESRLSPLAREKGFDSLGAMIDSMTSTRGYGDIHKSVVEALTTNETLFFRDLHPFEAMEKKLIPEIMARRATERRIDIWSGASSTGQEAYSIAMMLREKFPELRNWKVKIIGTDLCSKALEKANRGVYNQMEVNRGLPMPLLVKYFSKVDEGWELKPEMKQMTEFRKMNLIEHWPNLPKFDIVLMRNVLIYFDIETRRKILAGIRGVLNRDGAMFLGASETTFNVDENWIVENHGRSHIYRIKPSVTPGRVLPS